MKISQNDFQAACQDHPKYKALAYVIEQSIHSGELQDQEKLPAQRLLADVLHVTHGTITRAYALLEDMGLVSAKLGAGTYVTSALSTSHNNEPNTTKDYDFASSMQPMLGQQNILAQALNELSQDLAATTHVMTYAPQGNEKHKQVMSTWLKNKGIKNEANDIIFTQGAQQGIYTCLHILTNAGDYVLHESLTYPGFFRAAEANHVTPLAVPLTSDGLDLKALEDYCQQFAPKLLYITPNLQNPTNVQYSSDQLSQILDLSRIYKFFIIEDDVNYCLPENWISPLQQQAPEQVFYLSSLSKYMAGGLRIACALVPKSWQQAFHAHIHSQCWMVSGMNMELASRFLLSERFKHNQACLADEIRYRQKAFKTLLDKYSLKSRKGGLNVWVELPDHINMHQFNATLSANKIKVRTADLFANKSSHKWILNGLRLSLGGFTARPDFDRGIAAFERALIQFTTQQDVVI